MEGSKKRSSDSVSVANTTLDSPASSMAEPTSPRSIRWSESVVDSNSAQTGALGLALHSRPDVRAEASSSGEWEKPHPSTDISRTPSQSTTGTTGSHGSLETAASSLQSGASLTDAKAGDLTIALARPGPSHSRAAELISSDPYVTACSSPEEFSRERLETEALRRFHALHELVETERSYMEDLDLLVNVFFPHLNTQSFFEESPGRAATVSRNASSLLDLHTSISSSWSSIMEQHRLRLEDEGTLTDKARRCGEAVRQVADNLRQMAPDFQHYENFCSRHAEALVMIREAERRHNGDDFAAYERLCASLIRNKIQQQTPSRQSSGVITPNALGSIAAPLTSFDAPSPSAPPSGATTPSSSFASLTRSSTSRLMFADFLIKPVQRLCLYPLVLNALLKYTPMDEVYTRDTIQQAIDAMRQVADEVDRASRVREKDLMAELILARIEPHASLPVAHLKSLGAPQLSGTLDVLHHHAVEEPLTSPLRFAHTGVILWTKFVLFVRPRKNQQLECRHWLPLAGTQVMPPAKEKSIGRSISPFAFRLSYNNHHFELCATSAQEFKTWFDALRMASELANTGVLASDKLATTTATNGTYQADLALSYIFANASSMDGVLKMPTPSTRRAVDRAMIFSDVLVTPAGLAGVSSTMIGGSSTVRDISEALIAQQLRQTSTPSIGSAVGAAMGLAKMAATQMPTVKRVRKMNSLTPIDTSVGRWGEECTSAVEAHTTPKRNSLSTLRARSGSMTSGIDEASDVAIRRLSSPVESISARVRGSLSRANSRMAKAARSANGSLPNSPAGSVLDLSKTSSDGADTGRSSGDGDKDGQSCVRPPHSRAKSSSLRDIWQTSIGRRSRSQSAQTCYSMDGPYEGTVMGRYLPSQAQADVSPGTIPLEYTFTTSPVESQTALPPSGLHALSENDSPAAMYTISTDSMPNSASSSRRQSIASVLSWSYTSTGSSADAWDVATPHPPPSTSVTQIREGAAATLKRAKSAARHRLSMHSGLLASPAGTAALPLASDASAQGCLSASSAADALALMTVSDAAMADSVPTDRSPISPTDGESAPSPVASGSDEIVNRLRGSLLKTTKRKSSRHMLAVPKREGSLSMSYEEEGDQAHLPNEPGCYDDNDTVTGHTVDHSPTSTLNPVAEVTSSYEHSNEAPFARQFL